MKKSVLFFFASCLWSVATFAQLNMTLLSHIEYDSDGNDIWGWVAPDGTEYAIMGLVNGVSIVSLADPSNAQEVAFIPGQNSIWRDIKTWGNYAYVTTDQSGTTEGLTVIDMSNLPESAPYFHWTPNLPDMGVLQTCHNLYIDENGYCYLSGCNLNNGGILYIDVFSQPGTPIYVDKGAPIYSHDVYVRNNRMYTSEIYDGNLGVYDVSDKANTVFLGNQQTPYTFTHNSWLSDDGMVSFTTDERPNAPIGAFDVSDPADIVELDQFRPLATLGQGIIPHNVHVWQDWLIISYYTAGGVVVDASRPGNLIEVGNFDTFLGVQAGFNGAWGAYPFLPSGTVLVSDINSGLYVLAPTYVRACWLEGQVTDLANGSAINGVDISIAASQANATLSDPLGKYATGLATAGLYAVTFTKEGYLPLTVQAELNNGELTVLDVQLTPLTPVTLSGLVVDAITNEPVPFAKIQAIGSLSSSSISAGADGAFSVNTLFVGQYQLVAGAWGYKHKNIPSLQLQEDNQLVIALDRGYQDDFILSQGWITDSSTPPASSGFWVREKPIGTFDNGQTVNPDEDVSNDLGDVCYLTGNAGGGIGEDDVDNGVVILSSPPMDLSVYVDPIISYNLWFVNTGGNGTPNDALVVKLTNGIETVTVETVTQSQGAWRERSEIRVADHFSPLAGPISIVFETSDFQSSGHVVEAGVDAFLVEGELISHTESSPLELADLRIQPNPYTESFSLQYDLGVPADQAELLVINTLGQVVLRMPLPAAEGQVTVGNTLPVGHYSLLIRANGQLWQAGQVVKQ